ncbi:MAG: hypothetical protein H6R26_2056, partial [Proteobacteria bacterium]|nr:hypothetical protein [Pseudomonadota bacterium]
EQEYQECYHKAAALLHLLEQFNVKMTGADHVGR